MLKFNGIFILSGRKNLLKYVNNKQNVTYQKCKQFYRSSSLFNFSCNLSNHSLVINKQNEITDNSLNIKHTKLFSNHILSGRNFKLLNYRGNPLMNHQRFISDLPPVGLQIPVAQFNGITKILIDSPPIIFCQESLIWLHESSGLPWWAVIVLVTCTLRTIVTLPLAFYQQKIFAKVSNVKDEMTEVVERLKLEANVAVSHFDMQELDARQHYEHSVKQHWNELIIRHNCHPMKAFMIFMFQIPMWLILSAGIRNLCYLLPTPTQIGWDALQQLTVEGFGWISNLTVTDPYWILPIFFGVFNLINIQLQTLLRDKEPSKAQKISTNLSRAITIVIVPIAGIVPTCLSLYWSTSAAYGVFQSLIVISPKARRLMGVPESKLDIERPYNHLFNNLKLKLKLTDKKIV